MEIVVGKMDGNWRWFQNEAEANECGAVDVGPATPDESECAKAILAADKPHSGPPAHLGERMGRLLDMRRNA